MKYSILHIWTCGDETDWSQTQPDEDQVTSWVTNSAVCAKIFLVGTFG